MQVFAEDGTIMHRCDTTAGGVTGNVGADVELREMPPYILGLGLALTVPSTVPSTAPSTVPPTAHPPYHPLPTHRILPPTAHPPHHQPCHLYPDTLHGVFLTWA